MTGKRRNTIVVEFKRNKLDSSSVEDVNIYLSLQWWRIEELPEKVDLKEKVDAKAMMAEIERKVKEKENKSESNQEVGWRNMGIETPQYDPEKWYTD